MRTRFLALRAEIERECIVAGRDGGSVAILGVTKKQASESIREAIAAGLCDVGENYLQEAAAKFPELPSVRKHFIGHVQTNKAKRLVELFDVVQSIDRIEAGRALAAAAARAQRVLPVLIQLNISPSDRFGCAPEAAERLAEMLRAEPSLRLDGVMAIAPVTGDSEEIARAFALAAKTFGAIGGSMLSIGMSGDWRAAVRAGSTMLRIGTALFGERG